MSSLDVLQVPWGPPVRERMARQGMSMLLLPQSSSSLIFFRHQGSLGKFYVRKEKKKGPAV